MSEVLQGLPSLTRPSLRDQVISVLVGRILSREWEPGTRVPSEPELATQLGVSRSVVRDAVQVLCAWGLLKVRHGVGTTVTHPSAETVTSSILLAFLRSDTTVGDLLEAREVIDTAVAGAAAEGRTREDCEYLKGQLELMKREAHAGNWQGALRAHLEFHKALLLATNRPALIAILRPMQLVVLTSSLVPESGDIRFFDIAEHEALLDAVVSGDPRRAQSAMQQHFRFRQDESYAGLHSKRLSEVSDLVRQITDRGQIFGLEDGVEDSPPDAPAVRDQER